MALYCSSQHGPCACSPCIRFFTDFGRLGQGQGRVGGGRPLGLRFKRPQLPLAGTRLLAAAAAAAMA
jgi:hypothetical protein